MPPEARPLESVNELYRASGSGNDFLALVEPPEPPEPARIRAWCRRGVSLGADGLFVLRRTATGVRMDHWNADGRPAELCINGTRCAARLAFHLGWARDTVAVETGAGVLLGERAGDARVRLEVPPPQTLPEALSVEVEGVSYGGYRSTIGVPHFVVPWPAGLADAPLAALGPPLRHHPAFGGGGTNVDFVRFAARDRLEIRSWERGVEAETLACGTGVLAAALTGLLLREASLPLSALTAGGFLLEVAGERGDGSLPHRWSLTGDARIVARVEPFPDAEVPTAPPSWS